MKTMLLTLIAVFFCIGGAFAQSNQGILEKIDNIRAPGKTFTFNLKVTVHTPEKEQVTELFVRTKDSKKSLVFYKSPASEKGKIMLMVDDNMWIYMPGNRRPIRISPQQQILGRVSNSDVARVVFNLDYSVDSVKNGRIDNKDAVNISLKARTAGAAYSSIDVWAERETYKLIKADFFALSGRLLKTTHYRGYETILDAERPTILEVRDSMKKDEYTVMQYSNMKVEETPETYFQSTYMERLSPR